MFTTLDKAVAGGLAAGLMAEATKYIDINETLESSLVSLFTAIIIYFVKNLEK